MFILLCNPFFVNAEVSSCTNCYIFNSINNVSEFGSYTNQISSYENNSMKLLINNNDPVILKVFAENSFNCNEYKYMKIKFKAMTTDSVSQIYFDTYENIGMNESKKVEFSFVPGKWEEKIINLSENAYWKENLYRLRIDPIKTYSKNQLFYIEYIAFFKNIETANSYGGLTLEQSQLNEKSIINDNVLITFDINSIIKNITFKSNVSLGYKDKSLRVTSLDSPSQFGFFSNKYRKFLLNNYPVVKIKYFSHTKDIPMYIYYDTVESPGLRSSNYNSYSLNFNKINDSWKEVIMDMSYNGDWNNTSNEFRIITSFSNLYAYDVTYIEYIGFFKNVASANAYGGLTTAQKNNTDKISSMFVLFQDTKPSTPILNNNILEEIIDTPSVAAKDNVILNKIVSGNSYVPDKNNTTGSEGQNEETKEQEEIINNENNGEQTGNIDTENGSEVIEKDNNESNEELKSDEKKAAKSNPASFEAIFLRNNNSIKMSSNNVKIFASSTIVFLWIIIFILVFILIRNKMKRKRMKIDED